MLKRRILEDPKLAKLSLTLFSVLIYFPTLFFGYVYYDDHLLAQRSYYFFNPKNLLQAFTQPVWAAHLSDQPYYRPLSMDFYILSALASKAIAGGMEPAVFHLTNLILFSVSTLLLFLVLIELELGVTAALFSTALWVIHPMSVSTIAWICGQNELLLMTLILATFWALLKGSRATGLRRAQWIGLNGILFLAALLTKENALGWLFVGTLSLWLRKENRPRVQSFLQWSVVWLLALALSWSLQATFIGKTPLLVAQESRLLDSVIRGVPFLLVYFGKFLVPYGNAVVPTWQDTSPLTLLAGSVAAAGFLAAVYAGIQKKNFLVLVGACWFLVFLLPTFIHTPPPSSGWIDKTFILREDRAHLASLGLLFVGLGVIGLVAPTSWAEFKTTLRLRPKLLFAVFAAVGTLLMINLRHQFNYRSGMDFYQNAVEQSPSLAFSHVHLGDMYLADRNFEKALSHYQTAIQLDDREPLAHNNLGVAYLRMGQLELAGQEFQREVDRYPTSVIALFNMGMALFQKGLHADAEFVWKRVLQIDPAYSPAWEGLIQLYGLLKKDKELREAQEALLKGGEWDSSQGL